MLCGTVLYSTLLRSTKPFLFCLLCRNLSHLDFNFSVRQFNSLLFYSHVSKSRKLEISHLEEEGDVNMNVTLDEDYPPLYFDKQIEILKKPPVKRKCVKKSDSVIENRENFENNIEYTDNLEFHNFVSANSIFGSLIADVAHNRSGSSSCSASDGRSGNGSAQVNITSERAQVKGAKRNRSYVPIASMWWFDEYASLSRDI